MSPKHAEADAHKLSRCHHSHSIRQIASLASMTIQDTRGQEEDTGVHKVENEGGGEGRRYESKLTLHHFCRFSSYVAQWSAGKDKQPVKGCLGWALLILLQLSSRQSSMLIPSTHKGLTPRDPYRRLRGWRAGEQRQQLEDTVTEDSEAVRS